MASNKKNTNNLDNVNLIDSNSNSNSITTSTSSSSNANQNQNNNSTLRKRIANFKRLTDFRHSLKNEFKKTINQSKTINNNQNTSVQTFTENNNTPKTPKNHKNLFTILYITNSPLRFLFLCFVVCGFIALLSFNRFDYMYIFKVISYYKKKVCYHYLN
jgi:hypothetical protein